MDGLMSLNGAVREDAFYQYTRRLRTGDADFAVEQTIFPLPPDPDYATHEPRQAGAGGTAAPLTVQYHDTGEATVVYGTVTQSASGTFVPEISGNPISDDPAPVLSIGGNTLVYLHLTLADGEITDVDIETGGSVPANDGTNAYLLLAQIINYDAGAFDVLVATSGSQYYQLCGSEHLFGRI